MTQLSLGTEDQADEVNEAAGDFPFPASGTTAQHSDESDDDFGGELSEQDEVVLLIFYTLTIINIICIPIVNRQGRTC